MATYIPTHRQPAGRGLRSYGVTESLVADDVVKLRILLTNFTLGWYPTVTTMALKRDVVEKKRKTES